MKVIIIGAGKLGYKLAEEMNDHNIDVTVVDSKAKTIDKVNDFLDVLTFKANGVDLDRLKDLDVETYDLLIATTGSDETNALICTLGKRLGVTRTIARIRNPEYSDQMEFIKSTLGIDHIINPDFATAREITRYLLKRYRFSSSDFAGGAVQIMEMKVTHGGLIEGKRIMDLDFLDELLIIAIKRNGEIIIPNGPTEILAEDGLYLLGRLENIVELADNFSLDIQTKPIRTAMIMGGGKIGYFLTKKLLEENIQVTIIEQNYERCQYLSEELENALIIHGDGSDINLLEEENLPEMDAFIGLTGLDEQNLLMSLTAKQSGVRKTIAKFSRPSYDKLIDKIDIDVAFNPIYIAASEILKFVRGGRIISVNLILGGQAEVTEVLVDRGLTEEGIKIEDLNLPKGIIIGAITRDQDLIIPKGQTEIHLGDRIVIFSMRENIPELDQFLKAIKEGNLGELPRRHQGFRKFIGS